MRKVKKKVYELLHSPDFLRKFHGWSTIGWFVAAFPICIWLNQSVPFLVFISVYAIVVSHWEGWQSASQMKKEEDS